MQKKTDDFAGFVNQLLESLNKSKQFSLIADIIQSHFEVQIQTQVSNSILDNLVKQDQFEKAWQVFTSLRQKASPFDSFTFSALVKGITPHKNTTFLTPIIKIVQDTAKDSNFSPDEVLYNVLIDTSIKCKQFDQALEMFELMKREDSKVRPDEITFNTLIKGYSMNRDMENAFRVFEDMKRFGLKPNDVTYNSLIDTCVRSSDMDRAWTLFGEMQDNDIVPDNFTFSTLIKGIKCTKNPKKD